MKTAPPKVPFLLAVRILLFLPALLRAEDVLSRSDFEAGDSGWLFESGAVAPYAAADFPDAAKAGGHYARMNRSGSANLYLSQPVARDTTYTLSAQVGVSRALNRPLPSGTLTLFIYNAANRAETHNVAQQSLQQISATKAGAFKTVTLKWDAGASPAAGWNLGAQILANGGWVAFDDVQLLAAATVPPIRLEGKFGRLEINPTRPALGSLVLRNADGALERFSLLAREGEPWQRGVADWGTTAYTYVVTPDGRRFESRRGPAARVRRLNGAVILENIFLAEGETRVALERWTFTTSGGALDWRVEREWLVDFQVRLDGTPALFTSCRPIKNDPSTINDNATTHVLWYDPDQLESWYDPLYRQLPGGYLLPRNTCVLVAPADTWGVFKLFTAWDSHSDLKLAVTGGHLYRRGWFGWIGEAGAVTDKPRLRKKGEREDITLRVSPSPKNATGYQLVVDIPDKALQNALTGLYESLLNGGVVNDQKQFDFGNEVDGWFYSGSTWMQGMALAAGVPAAGPLAEHATDAARAFRGHLQRILASLDDQGRVLFGYSAAGSMYDLSSAVVMGTRAYLMHTGDGPWVRQHLPQLERMLEHLIGRRNAEGVLDLGDFARQYYDVFVVSGVNGYNNAFFFRALRDLADIERAMGYSQKAARYEQIAGGVNAGHNRLLWAENAPHGPRYLDWIAADGRRVDYASDISLFPPLAFGMASPDQARKLFDTIDRRIVELRAQDHYWDHASLSAYWPVPLDLFATPFEWPVYMNGGAFHAQTYWELMARARYGDAATLYRRLSRWAEGARLKQRWVGNNWAQINGALGGGASDEPYLSDMVVIPAALVQGVLGISLTWDKIEIEPCMPDGWSEATAEVMWKGQRYRVTARRNGRHRIEPLARKLPQVKRLDWLVEAGGHPVSEGFVDGRSFELALKQGAQASPGIVAVAGQPLQLAGRRPATGLVALWKSNDASSPSREGSAFAQALTASDANASVMNVPGGFDPLSFWVNGSAKVRLTDLRPFSFGPKDSFTVQCRFRTTSCDKVGIFGRPGSFSMGIKDGHVFGSIMSGDAQVVELLGTANIADDRWHHAALVVDRAKKQLRLSVDGREDGPPRDTFGIGQRLQAGSGVHLASVGGANYFTGSLDELSVHSRVLADTELAVAAGMTPEAPTIQETAEGSWSMTVNWNQLVVPIVLEVEAVLNGGQATVTLGGTQVELQSGRRHYELPATAAAGFHALKVVLHSVVQATPEVSSLRVIASPVTP
jgi:hypothetical protein